MTYKTHIAFSFLCLSIVNYFIPINFVVAIPTLFLSAILPDIDNKKSIISQVFKPVSIGMNKLAKVTKSKWFKHRSIFTHQFLQVLFLIITLLLYLQQYIFLYTNVNILKLINLLPFKLMNYKEFILVITTGMVSHSIIDYIASIFIKTGDKLENIIFWICWISFFILFLI